MSINKYFDLFPFFPSPREFIVVFELDNNRQIESDNLQWQWFVYSNKRWQWLWLLYQPHNSEIYNNTSNEKRTVTMVIMCQFWNYINDNNGVTGKGIEQPWTSVGGEDKRSGVDWRGEINFDIILLSLLIQCNTIK